MTVKYTLHFANNLLCDDLAATVWLRLMMGMCYKSVHTEAGVSRPLAHIPFDVSPQELTQATSCSTVAG
jgi:hypothetical protein